MYLFWQNWKYMLYTTYPYLRQSLCVLYSIVALKGKFSRRFKASLILEVVAWSDAVRFHILNKYSWYRVDTTTPHISFPAYKKEYICISKKNYKAVEIFNKTWKYLIIKTLRFFHFNEIRCYTILFYVSKLLKLFFFQLDLL